jgi:TonB family protein
MNRYLLSSILLTIFGALFGPTFLRAQAPADFCASFTSFSCENQSVHEPNAIGAVNINYPQQADSNVQIFQTPELAKSVFGKERSSGDLDILGRSEPTTEVGEIGYGYKRTGSAAQNNAFLVEYDFVRSCFLVILNNADGGTAHAHGSVKYSRESDEFALKFAQQLDQKLKSTPCSSTARSAKSADSIVQKRRPATGGFSFSVIESGTITAGAILIGLAFLLANKRRRRIVPAAATTGPETSAALAPSPISEPRAVARATTLERPNGDDPSLPSAPIPEQPHSLDKQAAPQLASTAMPDWPVIWATASRSPFRVLVLLTVTALLIVLFFEFGKRSSAYFSASSKSPTESSMGLKLERIGSDWRLSWNPDSAVISKASKGYLLITDGPSRTFLDLDSSDLRGGSVVYTPVTNDIALRLEVDTPDPPTTVSESVRTAAGPQSTLASNAGGPSSDGNRINSIPESSSARSSRSRDSGEGSDASAKYAQTSKANTLNTQEQLVHAKVPVSLPVSKSPGASTRDSAPELPIQPELTSQLSSAIALFSPSVPTPELTQSGPHLEPAQLIERRDPVYPSLASRAHFDGSVELHFSINKDGKVHNVTVVKGNPVLAMAAAQAVQSWRYNPARLNGIPIETESSAVINFKN